MRLNTGVSCSLIGRRRRSIKVIRSFSWSVLVVGRLAFGAQSLSTTEYTIPTPNSGVFGITAGPDGAMWFTEWGANKIGRITTAGLLTEYPVLAFSVQPYGITAGPDGALWFTEEYGNKIGRITVAGSITEYPIPTYGSDPIFITAGPDGALWFTEFQGQKIGRITTSGALTEYRISSGPGPWSIATGPDGALWFTEDAAGIGRITTSGVITEYPIPQAGSEPTITLGPDEVLWYTDSNNNAIVRTTVTSGSITVSTGPVALSFTVDGATYTGAASFNWAVGETHSIGIVSTPQAIRSPGQPIAFATRYAFSAWSDGGGQIHTINATPSTSTYTAVFTAQYLLTTDTSPPGTGGISAAPASTDGFYNSGTTVQLTAVPNTGFQFSN